VKAGTIARWVRSGQVVELYDLATGCYIGEMRVTGGKARLEMPRGLGIQVRDVYCDSGRLRPDTQESSTGEAGLRAS